VKHGRAITILEHVIRTYDANSRTQMDAGEKAKEAQAIVELTRSIEVLATQDAKVVVETTEAQGGK
jgi:hypothetical protein